MRTFYSIFSLLALVAVIFSTPAMAREGRIVSVAGGVTLERGGETLIAKSDMLLQAGDTLVTDIDGRVLWQMADESVFVMPENGRFEIVEHRPQAGSSGSGTVYYRHEVGSLRTHTGLVSAANGGSYKHETPAANVEAKGTDYVAILLDATRAADLGIDAGFYVLVKSGSVALANAAGNASMNKGEVGFAADANSAPRVVPDSPAVLIGLFLSQKFDFDSFGLEGDIGIEILPPGDGDGDGDGDPSPS